MADPILFFFDFASPYAYIGANMIDAVAAKHGRQVDWMSISLGHLWKAIGYDRSSLFQPKMQYSVRDWTRSAEVEGLPIVSMPKPFPVDSRFASRAFYRLKRDDVALAKRFALAAYDRYWGHGQDIGGVDLLAPVAKALGIDPALVAAAVDDEAAKKAVIDATASAAQLGAFGTPTFVVDGELFWGHDRISHVDHWLARKAKAA